MNNQLMDDVYLGRLDALEQIWQVWAALGDELTEQQWSALTRCPGWDVAAVYAHHSAFPLNMDAALPDGPVGEPVTAVELSMRFNAPDGAAHTMAATIADGAVSAAAAHTRSDTSLAGRAGRLGRGDRAAGPHWQAALARGRGGDATVGCGRSPQQSPRSPGGRPVPG